MSVLRSTELTGGQLAVDSGNISFEFYKKQEGFGTNTYGIYFINKETEAYNGRVAAESM